jgi:hypothetical protein
MASTEVEALLAVVLPLLLLGSNKIFAISNGEASKWKCEMWSPLFLFLFLFFNSNSKTSQSRKEQN